MQNIYDTKLEARVLDLLSAHETSKEFDRRREANRILHLCKTKGFKHLERIGQIEHGATPKKLIQQSKTRNMSQSQKDKLTRIFAARAETGENHRKIASELEVNIDTLKKWAVNMGLTVKRPGRGRRA